MTLPRDYIRFVVLRHFSLQSYFIWLLIVKCSLMFFRTDSSEYFDYLFLSGFQMCMRFTVSGEVSRHYGCLDEPGTRLACLYPGCFGYKIPNEVMHNLDLTSVATRLGLYLGVYFLIFIFCLFWSFPSQLFLDFPSLVFFLLHVSFSVVAGNLKNLLWAAF